MVDQINYGIHFFTVLLFSVLIWGALCAVGWYYYFSGARRQPFQSNDFLDLIPSWLMNTVLVAWFVAGSFPLLNYVADKAQFGGIVGRARELPLFDDRPWYGVGGYQWLMIVLILIVGT